MIYFNNDYSEGCHEKVLDALIRTNLVQTLGYGEDEYCAEAAAKIRSLCGLEHPVRLVICLGYAKPGDQLRTKKRKDMSALVAFKD